MTTAEPHDELEGFLAAPRRGGRSR
jgi:hypothetical protein